MPIIVIIDNQIIKLVQSTQIFINLAKLKFHLIQ